MTSVVVVGASLAGVRTVEALRQLGFEGDITLIGDERHTPYDRPPLSKDLLLGATSPDDIRLRDDAGLADLNVDLRLGTAAASLNTAERVVVLSDGSQVPYDQVVIATGARARSIGEPLDGVHTLRSLDDALAIRSELDPSRRLVVVGAGFIGCEVASVARELGCEVTVVSLEPVPLQRGVGVELGRVFVRRISDAGVDLRCETGVVGFAGDERVEAVETDAGRVDADLVVVGVGAQPNVEWLDGSGVRVHDGVVCDSRGQAEGVADVFAVGDVASWYVDRYGRHVRFEHWTRAGEQAGTVAATIVGAEPPPDALPYVWSDQFGTRVQVFGRVPEGQPDVAFIHGSEASAQWVAVVGSDGRFDAIVGLDAGKALRAPRKLLQQGASWAEAFGLGSA